MISEIIEVNQFAQIRLILDVKFGDDCGTLNINVVRFLKKLQEEQKFTDFMGNRT